MAPKCATHMYPMKIVAPPTSDPLTSNPLGEPKAFVKQVLIGWPIIAHAHFNVLYGRARIGGTGKIKLWADFGSKILINYVSNAIKNIIFLKLVDTEIPNPIYYADRCEGSAKNIPKLALSSGVLWSFFSAFPVTEPKPGKIVDSSWRLKS